MKHNPFIVKEIDNEMERIIKSKHAWILNDIF